jgi:hypothetical protein
MSTYPNNSVTCHFEDDLEIFLDKLDGYEWKKSFQPFLQRVKKAHANSDYLMMEKDKDSAPDIATKHTAYCPCMCLVISMYQGDSLPDNEFIYNQIRVLLIASIDPEMFLISYNEFIYIKIRVLLIASMDPEMFLISYIEFICNQIRVLLNASIDPEI